MQSGYGVSEIPQFMVDGLCSPFFPVAGAGAASSAADKHHQQQNLHQLHAFQQQQQQQQQYHLFHQYPHHLNLQQQAAPPPAMQPAPAPTHFHPIPITQQLFQQTHQFHLFQQEQQRRLQHHQHHMGLEQHDPTPPPEASASPPRMDSNGAGGGGGGISGFLGPSMSFRLSVNNDNSGGGSRDGLNDDDDGGGILHGDDVDGSESRWPPPPTSREEENSVIKEPFWRPLDLDLDFINRNNKRCKEKRHHEPPQQQPPPPQQQIDMEGSSIKHFKLTKEATTTAAEVEDGTNSGSNYKLFSELEAICKSGTVGGNNNNNNNNNNQTGSSSALTGENPPTMVPEPTPMNVAAAAAAAPSDGSTGEEASLKKGATTTSNNSNSKKARRKRRRKEQLSSISAFFETLVKQLMDHQENLHRKFLEVLEKRDRERMAMEESWRQQEATKSALEAKAREEEQAVAAAREAAIVAFLEKLTGETIPLPTRSVAPVEEERVVSSNRWPKAEVQALIGVRSGLEGRFQEPGLKGPLWEEVSIGMVALGYRRSAKRCKEKWENINKYFRKTKESSKKRSQHSKTCPYFHQLDQLYSKSTTNSEMLNAIVVASEDRNAFVDPNEPADGRDDRQTMTVVRREEEEEEEEDGEEEEEENGDGEIAPAEQHGRRRREEEGREGRRVTRVSCS